MRKHRTCRKCGILKSIDEFISQNGVVCNACKTQPRAMNGYRKCSKCGQIKIKTEFAKCGNICTSCNTRIKVNGFRTCERCGELKPKTEFVGIRRVCHLCKKPAPIKIYDNEADRKRAEKHRRRARKNLVPATLTGMEWNETKNYFSNKCVYCGSTEHLTQDHFIPVSKGGEYSKNNIVPACHMCNSTKRDLDFFEWYPQQTFYSKQREQKILEYLNYEHGYQQLAI